MRRANFRFTTRRFVVLVAILATALASGMTVNRFVHIRALYRERATHHRQDELNARFVLSYLAEIDGIYKELRVGIDAPLWDTNTENSLKELMKTDPEVQKAVLAAVQQKQLEKEMLEKEMLEPLAQIMKTARKEIEHHAQLKRKYEQAAARPWLPVLPDAKESHANLLMLTMEAMERMESKGEEIDRLPLPPQLEIIEPERSSGK